MQELVDRWLFDPAVGKLIASVVGLIVVFVIVRLLQRSISRYVADSSNRYRARKFVAFLGYLAAVGLLLTVFSDRLAGLTVAFGVAGAGIAFALQEVIASIAGWVALSFGGFYRTGDRVQLGGIRGDVIDIGVLRTTLMEAGDWVNGDLYNGRIVRIANSYVLKEPVFNYSADFPFLWDEITFPIRYGCDWQAAREMLMSVAQELMGDYADQSRESWQRVVRKFSIENARVEPLVTLRADENWIEFTVRYIVDYKKRRLAKDELFRRILEEIDNSNGSIRIATASMELSSSPVFDVRLNEKEPAPQA
jgi:small-conductance mechanosensitive channel